jgi:CRP-like cAMP-binding protein
MEASTVMISKSTIKNRLLRRFPDDAFRFLLPYMELVDLPLHYDLVIARKSIEYVCFLESGLASVVASSSDGKNAEIRPIGYEGMSGYPVVLGVDKTPNKTFMQVEGTGIKIAREDFLPVLQVSEARELLLRYVHTCEIQVSQSALAAAQFGLNQRLARWLLMCHDRLESSDLPLTHDFLALMLGVRRSGVTDHLHILEGEHAIKATRGHIKVLDRNLLEIIAGGSYGLPEQEYERLIGNIEVPPEYRFNHLEHRQQQTERPAGHHPPAS